MKALVLAAVLGLCVGCAPGTPEERATAAAEAKKRNDAYTVQYVTERIVYLRDSKSGLCFAYFWGGTSDGGPAFTDVPCEKVEHLLINRE